MDVEEIQDINSGEFGSDFKWGVSVAAYQTEGGYDCDGKGKSIWDVFAATKGKIPSGQNANTACDFYYRYKEDIDLIKKLNIPNFRFSIAWSRVLPHGTGEINIAGINYYNKVIDYCLSSGITPWVTLYHWDLPQNCRIKAAGQIVKSSTGLRNLLNFVL